MRISFTDANGMTLDFEGETTEFSGALEYLTRFRRGRPPRVDLNWTMIPIQKREALEMADIQIPSNSAAILCPNPTASGEPVDFDGVTYTSSDPVKLRFFTLSDEEKAGVTVPEGYDLADAIGAQLDIDEEVPAEMTADVLAGTGQHFQRFPFTVGPGSPIADTPGFGLLGLIARRPAEEPEPTPEPTPEGGA